MPILAKQVGTIATYSGWSNREMQVMNLRLANGEMYLRYGAPHHQNIR